MRATRGSLGFVGASLVIAVAWGCGGASPAATNTGDPPTGGGGGGPGGGATVPPSPSCGAEGGSASVAAPELLRKLVDEGGEGWAASPAIADIDGDGAPEIIVARGGHVLAWRSDGSRVFAFDTGLDRVWASPAVADFTGDAKLEIALAARTSVFLLDASGAVVTGFPKTWGDQEARTFAAGDLDGDGALDLVVGNRRRQGDQTDIVNAFRANGAEVPGFPPVASGVSGCDPGPCYFAGLYDQNLAIGDLDGDGKQDLVLPHDNAYASIFKGTGAAFDASSIYRGRPKTPGVRYCHLLSDAEQGYLSNDDDNQAHFTNTPPAIADVDQDGKLDVVMVGSVQNGAQSDRKRGVALWVLGSDASRRAGWEEPLHVAPYVMGLGDGFNPELDGTAVAGASNLVGLTNQVTVADIDPGKAGLEMIFAGYDGKIHAVAADKSVLWEMPYATDGRALTGGVVVADLSADGVPEIVFATYSPDQGRGALYVVSSTGQKLHEVALPKRGSMAVPTIGDVDGDGTLDVVVSLKDAEAGNESVLIFTVPGSKPNCLLWPTGRANLLRNGWVR